MMLHFPWRRSLAYGWLTAPVRALGARLSIFRRTVVTAVVEDGRLRLVAFRGRRVVAWTTALLDSGDDGSQSWRRQAPKGLRDRRAGVVAELPSHQSLVRCLELPIIRRRYLEPVVASEIQESIPFPSHEVEAAWTYRRRPGGLEAMAIVASRRDLDDRVSLLKAAGLVPGALFSRATALACAAGLPDALLVNVAPAWAEIIVVRRRAPRVIHITRLPPGGSSEAVEATARAVGRVIGYYEGLNGGEQVALPVVVTGQLDADRLAAVLGREVRPFAPPVHCPDDFPACEYAANIGLALAEGSQAQTGSRAAGSDWPPVDLLPKRHHRHAGRLRPLAVIGVLAALVLAAYVATPQVATIETQATELRAEVAQLRLEARLQRLARGRLNVLDSRVQAANIMSGALEALPAKLALQLDTLLERMDTVAREADLADVRLSTLTMDKQYLTLSGSAPSYGGVSSFASRLQATELFADVRILLAEGQEAGGGSGAQAVPATVRFQIKAVVALEAPPDAPVGPRNSSLSP